MMDVNIDKLQRFSDSSHGTSRWWWLICFDGTYVFSSGSFHHHTLSIFTLAIVGGELGGSIGEVDEKVYLSNTC